MRILHVITSMLSGGAEHLMVDLLPRLHDLGNDVEIVVFNGIRTPFYKKIEDKGIVVHSFGRSFYNPLYIVKLYRLMRNYDIIHTHNYSPQLFAAICNFFCGSILCTTEHSTLNRRRKWKCFRLVDKLMYSKYDAIICISDQTKVYLDAYLGKGFNTLTITNGIPIGDYVNAQPCGFSMGTIHQISSVMMISGFRKEKDHKTLIKAFTYLDNSFHLFLVGDGVKRKEIENMVFELNLEKQIHFLGVRSDIPDLLKSVDIVVLSSHWEGFGLAIVEGMAAGKPVIASDVDGLKQVVKGYGVLFPHGDAEALAKEIQHLAEDKEYAAEVARRCQKRAADFDISVMAEKYNQVYQELMGTID